MNERPLTPQPLSPRVTRRDGGVRRRRLPVAVVGIVTLLLVGLPFERTGDLGTVASFLVPSLTTAAIFAIVCVGLNVQWGYAGIFNFGVLAFFMAGAYAEALVMKGPADGEYATYVAGWGEALGGLRLPGAAEWLPFLVALVIAGIAAGLLGALVALPTLRLREEYLAIAVIGIAETLHIVVSAEGWLANGSRGLGGIPRPLGGWVGNDTYRYVFFAIVLGLLALVYLAVEAAVRSPWGRVLRALREDDAATAASGKDVFAAKTQSFVLGATIMGMAGALFAVQQGATSPDAFNHFFGTFIFWAMLIVGGSGNRVGAIAGAYVVWGLWAVTLQLQGYDLPGGAAVQSRLPHLRDFLFGVAIVAVLLVAPRGLLPERLRVSRWLDRTAAGGAR